MYCNFNNKLQNIKYREKVKVKEMGRNIKEEKDGKEGGGKAKDKEKENEKVNLWLLLRERREGR